MGRTVPSFRIALSQEKDDWRDFRANLNKKDKETFDKIFSMARLYVSACMMCCRPIRLDCILMAILFEHYKQILCLSRHGFGGKNEYLSA